MNYRKFYQEQVGKEYDSSIFDIHHINGNHNDNRLVNMVALPRKLHRQYHYYKGAKNEHYGDFDEICDSFEVRYAKSFIEKEIYNQQRFLEVLDEAAKWVDERDRLIAQNATINVYTR